MEKSPDAFRTISEVADWLGVPAHVLRFWESKFTQVKPVKRAGGRRYYRPADMALLGGIKTLLHDDGMTIKGVQKVLRDKGLAHVSGFSPALDAAPGESAKPVDDAFELEVEELAQPSKGENVVPFQARDDAQTGAPPEAATETPPEAQAGTSDKPQKPTAPKAKPAEAAKAKDKPTQPPLPSFLTQPLAGKDKGPRKPRIVDAPDPDPEDRIAVSPGALALVGHVARLDAASSKALAPLLGRLAVLRDRMNGARG